MIFVVVPIFVELQRRVGFSTKERKERLGSVVINTLLRRKQPVKKMKLRGGEQLYKQHSMESKKNENWSTLINLFCLTRTSFFSYP